MAGNLKNFKLRGSCTVEMAMISGVWLLVIFASLLLVVGSMEKVINTADGVEAAGYGSGKRLAGFMTVWERRKEKGRAQERHTVCPAVNGKLRYRRKTDCRYLFKIWNGSSQR